MKTIVSDTATRLQYENELSTGSICSAYKGEEDHVFTLLDIKFDRLIDCVRVCVITDQGT